MFRRTRWKASASLATALFLGVVASFLIIRQAHERKEFVSRVNPVSGYRCRFMLSSAWKSYAQAYPTMAWSSNQDMGFIQQQSPIRQWIDARILRKPVVPPPSIVLMDDTTKPSVSFHLIDGYPEPSINRPIHIIKHRHLKVDGYPATVFAADSMSNYTTALLVYLPTPSVAYIVFSRADAAHFDQTDQEMQVIIASFHIEKVNGGTR